MHEQGITSFHSYFNRDVECIRTFFRRRFQYESALYPRFTSTLKDGADKGDGFRLDVVVAASGFTKKDQQVLTEVRLSLLHTRNYSHTVQVHGNRSRGRTRPWR